MQINSTCLLRGSLTVICLACLVGVLSVPLAAGHTPPAALEHPPTSETVDRAKKGDRFRLRQTRQEVQFADATEPAATVHRCG